MKTAIVYGAERSGSTMLRLMLDGHSKLSCTGEHDYLFDYLLPDGDGWVYDIAALSSDRIFLSQGLSLPSTASVDVALPQLLDQIARQGAGETSILMLHRNFGRITGLLPNVPIHLLRDPRDVARSRVGMGWAGNVYSAVDGWLEVEEEWKAVTGRHPNLHSIELRYEDLVCHPERELGRVCELLNTSYEAAMLSYPTRSTYSAPDSSFAEQWRRKMPPRQQRLVETRLGPFWPRPDMPQRCLPSELEPAAKALAKIDDMIGKHRFQLDRFGLLHVKNVLGRKLGLGELERSSKRQMDIILQERYLR